MMLSTQKNERLSRDLHAGAHSESVLRAPLSSRALTHPREIFSSTVISRGGSLASIPRAGGTHSGNDTARNAQPTAHVLPVGTKVARRTSSSVEAVTQNRSLAPRYVPESGVHAHHDLRTPSAPVVPHNRCESMQLRRPSAEHSRITPLRKPACSRASVRTVQAELPKVSGMSAMFTGILLVTIGFGVMLLGAWRNSLDAMGPGETTQVEQIFESAVPSVHTEKLGR